jgi:hypothetical protein
VVRGARDVGIRLDASPSRNASDHSVLTQKAPAQAKARTGYFGDQNRCDYICGGVVVVVVSLCDCGAGVVVVDVVSVCCCTFLW